MSNPPSSSTEPSTSQLSEPSLLLEKEQLEFILNGDLLVANDEITEITTEKTKKKEQKRKADKEAEESEEQVIKSKRKESSQDTRFPPSSNSFMPNNGYPYQPIFPTPGSSSGSDHTSSYCWVPTNSSGYPNNLPVSMNFPVSGGYPTPSFPMNFPVSGGYPTPSFPINFPVSGGYPIQGFPINLPVTDGYSTPVTRGGHNLLSLRRNGGNSKHYF